jgi:5-oxoprolinase (ATP-hydrolysing) subunit A
MRGLVRTPADTSTKLGRNPLQATIRPMDRPSRTTMRGMPRVIDLNADLGESYGRWVLGDDASLVRHITSANLACGFHAGDPTVMDATVRLCRDAGVAVGAQPGYPDMQGFGRRPMELTTEEIEQTVLYQLGALSGFCRSHGIELAHVKPHGALYNRAADDLGAARGIARGVARFSTELPLVGLAGSDAFAAAAEESGLRFVAEAFADRRYEPDGRLRSRRQPDALIANPAEAAHQALRIAMEGAVSTADGSVVRVDASSICVHGDSPDATLIAAAVRARLEEAGIGLRPIRQL